MVAPEGIGELLTTIRRSAGRTREEQAELLQQLQPGGFDPDNLKRWETERRLPTRRWHQLLAAGYELPIEEIMRAVAASRRWRRDQAAANDTAQEDTVERRNFLTAATAAAIPAALPATEQIRQGINAGLSGAGPDDLAYLDAAFERHQTGYHGRSPAAMLRQMHDDLTLLRRALARPHPARTRADLARTAAGLTGLVAIIQHDRGDQRSAHNWFTTAHNAAVESGDRRMAAWVLARHAMVPLNYGAPAVAVGLAARARAEAGSTPSAASALACAVAARALAWTGDHHGALKAVADARDTAEKLTTGEGADIWLGYPQRKHHIHLSQAFTAMGRTREAYEEQDAALALTRSPSSMIRGLLAMDTAMCLRIDGDPTTAAQTAVDAWDQLPPQHRDGLVRSRAEALHRKLTGKPRTLLGDALSC